MLDFGLKRIIKKLLVANVFWLFVLFIIDIFKLNAFDNLVSGSVTMPKVWLLYLVPTAVLIAFDFFYERIIRLEVKDDLLLITGLKFLLVHTLHIKKEDVTYKITFKNGFRTKHIRYLRIFDKHVEKYIIKEGDDLNQEQMDQVETFFRTQLPDTSEIKEG